MADEAVPRYKATLVRGQVYYLGNTIFTVGTPKEVDQVTKETLERDAIDMIKVERNLKPIQKFTFGVFDPSAPVVPAPKVRNR